jgi:hypothetical protein
VSACLVGNAQGMGSVGGRSWWRLSFQPFLTKNALVWAV